MHAFSQIPELPGSRRKEFIKGDVDDLISGVPRCKMIDTQPFTRDNTNNRYI
jgi:hypothetical protein